MAIRRLNHAVLYVHGLQRTVDFYRQTLGLEVRMEIPGRAAFLRAPGSANDHDLGVFEIGVGRAPDRPEYPGLYHLAWEVGTLGDLADTRARLVAAGVLVGESDHRVSKSLYAKDPSGIEFEVMWRVPAEEWEVEMAEGDMILPLDWDATLARWGRDQVTGAAAGSPT
jgi:catechol-2,3-dioxygenase